MSDLPPEVQAQIDAATARRGASSNGPYGPRKTTQQRKEARARAEAENIVPLYHPVDWSELWAEEGPANDWLAEPVLPTGRQVALYSPAKAGKSLITLDIVAALATGRPVLGNPAREPVDVLYVDMEMTRDDLRERLEDLGYGPETDLSHLHYYCQQVFPVFDERSGGMVLEILAHHHHARLVVIDTMARVVSGEENVSDTYRAFYLHTGIRLKQAGISLLRLDHEGKNAASGQRGSSAKNDDVDLVWRLRSEDKVVTLTCTHTRLSWVPPEVVLKREEEPLAHVLAPDTYPAGTIEVVRLLDDLDVPLDVTVRRAQSALRSTKQGRRQELVRMALKYRKRRGFVYPIHVSGVFPDTGSDTQGDTGGHVSRVGGTHCVSLTGTQVSPTDPDSEEIDPPDPLDEEF